MNWLGWGTLESQTFQSTPSVPDSTVQWQNELFSPRLYSPELFSPRPFSLELFSPRPFSPELFSPRLYSPMEKWTFQSQTFQSWTLQSKTFQSWTFQSQTFQSQTLQSQGQNELFSPRPKWQLFECYLLFLIEYDWPGSHCHAHLSTCPPFDF